jgi:hypothetical protein
MYNSLHGLKYYRKKMIMKNIINNNQGSAIATTIFLLFGIIAIAMIGIEIVTSGLEAYRAQGSSTKAYYAAETGIERALAIFKLDPNRMFMNTVADCVDKSFIEFDAQLALSTCVDMSVEVTGQIPTYNVGGDPENAEYWVSIKYENSPYEDQNSTRRRQVVLTAVGHYLNTNRSIETRFCIPECIDNYPTDGCGGTCEIAE